MVVLPGANRPRSTPFLGDMSSKRRRGLLPQRDKELLMALLLRNPQVFEVARTELSAAHFGPSEIGYSIVWQLLLEFWDTYGTLPMREFMFAEVDGYLGENPGALTESEEEELNSWLDMAYDERQWKGELTTGVYVKWGIDKLKRFAMERVSQVVSQEAAGAQQVTGDLAYILSKAQDYVEHVEQLGSSGETLLFPDGWERQLDLQIRSTGVDFIDEAMGGGDRPGEAYGIMGPYGSAKTTLSFMLAIERAKQAAKAAAKPGWDGKHEMAVLVCYETPMAEARARILMYAANIHRQSLERLFKYGKAAISSRQKGDYRRYERRLAAFDQTDKPPGELERIEKATKMLDPHLLVLDLSGRDKHTPGAGTGYIPEVARRIKWELRRRANPGLTISGVYLDYVGLMVGRHMRASDVDENQRRHLVGGAPDAAKTELAHRFGCPVYLAHQMNREGNKRSPLALMDYTHSAESGNFAENLDYCLCFGRIFKRLKQDLCLLTVPKHRRTGAVEQRVLQMCGMIHRLRRRQDLQLRGGEVVAAGVAAAVGSSVDAEYFAGLTHDDT